MVHGDHSVPGQPHSGRQRRAFLNLLRLPLRAARPASGMVAIDSAAKSPALPPLLPVGTSLAAGGVTISTNDELQPTPLNLAVVAKLPVSATELEAAGVTVEQLAAHYNGPVLPFRPVPLVFPATVSLASTLDKSWWLCLWIPASVGDATSARTALSGRLVNLGVVPAADRIAQDAAQELPPRRWLVEVVARDENEPAPVDGPDVVRRRPVEILNDTTRGGRVAGVLRLRLPPAAAMVPPTAADPQFAGMGDTPPEPPDDVPPQQVVAWLRLSCPADPNIDATWIGLNATTVKAQGSVRGRVLAVGDGRPEQAFDLGQRSIDLDTMLVEVETGQGTTATWQPWTRAEHLGAARRDDQVYVVDGEAGILSFGDGLRGQRLPAGKRLRVGFRFGGGAEGNLAAGAISGLAESDARYRVRHELAMGGGLAGESVTEAEQRIGAFLSHRDRAVTLEDYRSLALEHPTARVARAEVVAGLVPSATPALVRADVPGALSVFVLPPAELAIGHSPRATEGLLRDVYAYLSAAAAWAPSCTCCRRLGSRWRSLCGWS